MLVLLCFALAYALVGAATQVTRDAAGGLQAARQRAWSTATRRVANMRAAGPRHVGWWLWLTGATVYHTARYTVRGTRAVGRSVRTGWSIGWQRGRDRYAERAARRTGPPQDGAPFRTFADRWRTTRRADPRTAADETPHDGPDPVDEGEPETTAQADPPPAREASQPGHDGADDGPAMTLTRCEQCGTFGGADHECTSGQGPSTAKQQYETTSRCAADWANRNGTGAVVMASLTTGEATNIEAARYALQALRTEAEQTVARVDQLSASLQSADLDSQTLGEVAEILEAADAMKTAADKAFTGLRSRHGAMEEAVNATPHAAKTEWYQH